MLGVSSGPSRCATPAAVFRLEPERIVVIPVSEITEVGENAERRKRRRDQGTPFATGPDRLDGGDSRDRDHNYQHRGGGGGGGADDPRSSHRRLTRAGTAAPPLVPADPKCMPKTIAPGKRRRPDSAVGDPPPAPGQPASRPRPPTRPRPECPRGRGRTAAGPVLVSGSRREDAAHGRRRVAGGRGTGTPGDRGRHGRRLAEERVRRRVPRLVDRAAPGPRRPAIRPTRCGRR